MKNIPLRFAIFSLFIFATSLKIFAQNTRELFSRPGLSIGAYHFNFFDGTWNTSYRYAGDTLLCGDTLLVFDLMRNPNYHVFLSIQGEKVYQRYPDYSGCPLTLFYDFGLQTGDTFSAPGGPIFTVVETGQKTLLNGETRRYLNLSTSPSFPYTIEWIEGIGDVTLGLLPFFADFEGYDQFVCARDASGDLWFDMTEEYLCDSLLCPVPIANFNVEPGDNFTFQFNNSSTDAQIFEWDFGDGHTASAFSPQHTYDEQGCYDVCLTVRSNCLTVPRKICKPVNAGTERFWKELPFEGSPGGSIFPMGLAFPATDTGWVTSTGKIWKTTDGGQNWAEQALPPAAPGTTRVLNNLFMANTQTGIIGCGSYGSSPEEINILITTDGGQNWLPAMQGDGPWINDALLQADGQGFAIASYHGIFHTLDYGQNWTEKDYPNGLGGLLHPVKLLPVRGDTIFILGALESFSVQQFVPFLMRSNDAGDNWTIDYLADHPIQYEGFFSNSQQGWLPGGVGYLLQTTDAGVSWTNVGFNETRRVFDVSFADNQHGWAVGADGLIVHTTDGGLSWERENCGALEPLLFVATPADTVAYSVTQNGKILKYCGGNCTTVSNSHLPLTMVTARLLVLPNPASTQIEVIPENGTSFQPGDKLLIFNSLGQRVLNAECAGASISLDVSFLPAGWYSLQLQRNGATLARGLFVVAP